MKIELIDTNEIVGFRCPKTGTNILWDDENISNVLPGTVVLALIVSLCPEECGVEDMPLAEAWNQHYASVNRRKMTLDEVVEAFPPSGKALKIANSGMACGPVYDVTYFIVPEELPDECFIHADFEADDEADIEK